jgi:hypothetical protein
VKFCLPTSTKFGCLQYPVENLFAVFDLRVDRISHSHKHENARLQMLLDYG